MLALAELRRGFGSIEETAALMDTFIDQNRVNEDTVQSVQPTPSVNPSTHAKRKRGLAAGPETQARTTREAIAQILNGGGLLLLANLLVLLLVGRSLETLPWQSTAQEVHEDVTERLEIVATGLFAPEMGVDAHVSSGTGERLAFPVRDVLLRLGVTVLLRHTKVDDVDDIGALGAGAADKEVVGLDVAVDEVLLVDGLNP
jgi:hypothetical protein